MNREDVLVATMSNDDSLLSFNYMQFVISQQYNT